MEATERLIIGPLQITLERLQAFLPQLIAALMIAAFGMLAGWLLKVVLNRILHWLKFDAGCSRLGLSGVLERSRIGHAPSRVVAGFCGGMVVLVFLLLAINSINVAILQNLTERFLIYLPNILVAGLVLLMGILFGNFLGHAALIACVNAGNPMARVCARMVRILIFALGGAIAMEQLGIGREAVLMAFGIAFGGVVMAFALAFGLGGRDLAREFLEKKFRGTTDKDEIRHL